MEPPPSASVPLTLSSCSPIGEPLDVSDVKPVNVAVLTTDVWLSKSPPLLLSIVTSRTLSEPAVPVMANWPKPVRPTVKPAIVVPLAVVRVGAEAWPRNRDVRRSG